MANILILGAGSMGTAFSFPCSDNNHVVSIVGTYLENDFIDQINSKKKHPALDCDVPKNVKFAFLVFISFIISVFILSSILTLDNLTFENSFKLSILTLTNTVSSALYSMDNFSFLDLNILTKMSLILFMILGKIEIIAVIYLIKKFIFRE